MRLLNWPLLFCVGLFLVQPCPSRARKKARTPAIAVSPEQLAAAFATNEVRAEDRFEGQRPVVRGRGFFVQRAADSPCIEINCRTRAGYEALLVCTGYGPNEAGAIKAGDVVTVEGKFHTLPYRQFALTDCQLKEGPVTKWSG